MGEDFAATTLLSAGKWTLSVGLTFAQSQDRGGDSECHALHLLKERDEQQEI